MAQKRNVKKAKAQTTVVEINPEELAEKALAEERQHHYEELLESTKQLIFVDSIVVDKDNFLSHLRLSEDAGTFTTPERLFASSEEQHALGQAAFINSMKSAVYFSASDSTGTLSMHASYRNGAKWSTPQQLQGLEGFDYQDYPFLLTDGTTLYFAAEGEESLGGLDIFVTRYSNETHQFVRPENIGLPFNSSANDYLLAIDDLSGIGALVTDRRQPDDKVCIYWFVASNNAHTLSALPTYDYDEDDDMLMEQLKSYAAIKSIADTQKGDTNLEAIKQAKELWKKALAADSQHNKQQRLFVVNDNTVYDSLNNFTNEEAKKYAAEWLSMMEQSESLKAELEQLRYDFALTRSEKTGRQIVNIETQISEIQKKINKAAKSFRRAELSERR